MSEALPVGASATAWAREHGTHCRFSALADNYEPARAMLYGDAYEYRIMRDTIPGASAYEQHGLIIPDGMDTFRGGVDAHYLTTDGTTLTMWYVAGYHNAGRYLVLHEIPADMHPLGPARTYHLTLTPA